MRAGWMNAVAAMAATVGDASGDVRPPGLRQTKREHRETGTETAASASRTGSRVVDLNLKFTLDCNLKICNLK